MVLSASPLSASVRSVDIAQREVKVFYAESKKRTSEDNVMSGYDGATFPKGSMETQSSGIEGSGTL